MEIFVCVTRVPDVSEVEIELDRGGQSVVEDDFDYGINEWDNFALECAVRLKEARGGKVTAITVGDEDAEEVLRRALAMGADAAQRLWDPSFAGSDSWGIAGILHRAIAAVPYPAINAQPPCFVLHGIAEADTLYPTGNA